LPNLDFLAGTSFFLFFEPQSGAKGTQARESPGLLAVPTRLSPWALFGRRFQCADHLARRISHRIASLPGAMQWAGNQASRIFLKNSILLAERSRWSVDLVGEFPAIKRNCSIIGYLVDSASGASSTDAAWDVVAAGAMLAER
jgi:hypothetical protein